MKISGIRSGESPKTADPRPQPGREQARGLVAHRGQGRLDGRHHRRHDGRHLGGTLATVLLALALISAPSVGMAGSKAGEVGRESGLGAAAAISSLVYGPLKLVYATGGLVVGAFAWAFTAGDTQVADKVFTRSLRGTYVITPQILLGEERLEFIGRDVRDAPTRTESVASAETAPPAYEDPTYDELGW
ncbi:MAG: hypothetical protein ACX98W_03225 [bacterium]